MAAERATTKLDKLTSAQRRLLTRTVTAQKRATEAQVKADELIKARNELVKESMDAGIGISLLSDQTGINRGIIWKIQNAETSQSLLKKKSRRR